MSIPSQPSIFLVKPLSAREYKGILMPTGLVVGAYRFFFWSYDCSEPAHIHVQCEKMIYKIWLENLQVANNIGFRAKELRTIQRIISENIEGIRRSWDEHCNPA